MLRLALVFLVVALIAGALGAFDVAIISQNIAWFLFVLFVVLFAVAFIIGGGWGRSGEPPVV